MKQTLLLLSFLSICFTSLYSQIVYKDYGVEGLKVEMNENLAMDLDEDGIIDFYVNKYDNELGFSPIFANGCFASPAENAYTSFDAREIQIFEEGESILINGGNLFDYIDDDRGSIYQGDGIYADNWEDGVDQYIGFALVNGTSSDGWMRIAINEQAQQLIIYELAFVEQEDPSTAVGIKAGQTSLSNIDDLSLSLGEINMGPNPVVDFLRVDFDYQDNLVIDAVVVDVTGKEIYRTISGLVNGNNVIEVSTDNWGAGNYFLQLSNGKGIKTLLFTVSR